MHAGCRKQLEPVPPTDRRALGRSLDTAHARCQFRSLLQTTAGDEFPRDGVEPDAGAHCLRPKYPRPFPFWARAHSHHCGAVDATAAIWGERSRRGQFDVMHQATTEPRHPTPRFTPEVEGLE